MEDQNKKKRVIGLLQRQARMPFGEIARRLNISEEEVKDIVTGLEKDRTIVGYTAIVNDEEVASDAVRAIIEVEVQPERDTGYDTLAEKIGKFPEVVALYLVSGRYDLRLEVVGESLQAVASFVSGKLACQPGVKSTATYFMLKKYKEAGIQLTQGEKYERLKIVP